MTECHCVTAIRAGPCGAGSFTNDRPKRQVALPAAVHADGSAGVLDFVVNTQRVIGPEVKIDGRTIVDETPFTFPHLWQKVHKDEFVLVRVGLGRPRLIAEVDGIIGRVKRRHGCPRITVRETMEKNVAVFDLCWCEAVSKARKPGAQN